MKPETSLDIELAKCRYVVEIDSATHAQWFLEFVDWFGENIKGRWVRDGLTFRFEDLSEATHFKLRWR